MRISKEASPAIARTKRTPSFTTRRNTSFRKSKKLETLPALPAVEIQGYLERKQELQSGGKRAAIRSWKTYYSGDCFLFSFFLFLSFSL